MPKIHFPHDKLFKTLMADYRIAKEFFARHLPTDILAEVNLNHLSLCQQTYIDEKLKSSHLDLLYKVNMANEDGYIFLLCEHQSTPDRLMPFRLLNYNVAIWESILKQNRKGKLCRIVNLVFYTGNGKYNFSSDFKDLFQSYKSKRNEIWLNPFILIYLQCISDNELKKYYWSGTMEFFMKNLRKPDFFSYIKEVVPQLQWLRLNDGKHCVESLLKYAFSHIHVDSIEAFIEKIKYELSHSEGAKMTTVAELYSQQGMQQGMQQGEKSLFSLLLQSKFPVVAENYFEKLKDANSETLRFWSKRLLKARSIDEVFKNN